MNNCLPWDITATDAEARSRKAWLPQGPSSFGA